MEKPTPPPSKIVSDLWGDYNLLLANSKEYLIKEREENVFCIIFRINYLIFFSKWLTYPKDFISFKDAVKFIQSIKEYNGFKTNF